MGCSSSSTPAEKPARSQQESRGADQSPTIAAPPSSPSSPKRERGHGNDNASVTDKTLLSSVMVETALKGVTEQGAMTCIEEGKFQINLFGEWLEFEAQEDRLLKRGYLLGHENLVYTLRGCSYETHYLSAKQTNTKTRKERDIHMPALPTRPQVPLVPKGPVLIRLVGREEAGKAIAVRDVFNEGAEVIVFVPQDAKEGDKMAVPIPAKGESIKELQQKQKKHHEKIVGVTMVAQGASLVAEDVVGVGGVVLGSHLRDVATREARNWVDSIADWLGDAAEDKADFVFEVF